MPWKTSWSYAQRGTNFTFWEQTSFIYTFRNNLHGTGCRLKYSNWYGKAVCEVSSVKLTMGKKAYVMRRDGKEAFFVSNEADCYSDCLYVDIEPCEVKVEMKFASSKRPESGNTFRPGIVMILQSLEVFCEEQVHVAALFGDSITHWGNWSKPLIDRMYRLYPGKLAVFEVAINGSRLLNGSPSGQLDCLGYDGQLRFEHDVLELEGISVCVFAMGLNDLALPEEEGNRPLTFDTYTACASELIRKAHEKGVRIIGLTICPRVIDQDYTEARNELRKKINYWIMKQAPFDRCIDVAKLVTNETDTELDRRFDCGDGVHINEAAGETIAEAFENDIFNNLIT